MHRTFGRWGQLDFIPCYAPDGDGTGGGDADAIKKANFERDSANARAQKLETELADLKKQLPSAETLARFKELEAQAAQADEDKKKAAGAWDTLKAELIAKHKDEMAALVEKQQSEVKRLSGQNTDLESLIAQREIDVAFANAFHEKSPLFGGDKSLTVYTPALGANAFRPYVRVEFEEVNGKRQPVLKVVGPDGKVIINNEGKPEALGPALMQVITKHPDKDFILRGSGKTGSGSSGGANGSTQTLDLAQLTEKARQGDKDALKQLQQRSQGRGDMQMGPAFG